MGLSLPNSCCCLSLRTVSMIIASVTLVLTSLYMVLGMSEMILYMHRRNETSDEVYHDFISMVSYEYMASAQIVFSAFLLYGCIQEISCFTLSWLICETGVFLSMLVNVMFMIISHFFFFPEDIILLTLLGGSMFMVYSYYDKMKKPEAV